MKAMMIKTLINSPADFHPALTKPIVKGEEADFESAFRRRGESEGQINPWKKMIPM
jgi:hypothetical protein